MAKEELDRLQQGAQAEKQSRKEIVGSAKTGKNRLKKKIDDKLIEITQHDSEIEQLRRRNQDLAESVQSLTHALQTENWFG